MVIREFFDDQISSALLWGGDMRYSYDWTMIEHVDDCLLDVRMEIWRDSFG